MTFFARGCAESATGTSSRAIRSLRMSSVTRPSAACVRRSIPPACDGDMSELLGARLKRLKGRWVDQDLRVVGRNTGVDGFIRTFSGRRATSPP